LHCTIKDTEELGIKNGDMIKLRTWNMRSVIFENVVVRAKDTYALDFHIDIDEANAAWVKPGDWAELVK